MIAALAGLICGVLSGMGVGGGTLLMVWMTAVQGMQQSVAQSINLLYFLPTGLCALLLHLKHGLIRARIVLPAIAAGCLAAVPTAYLATLLDTALLRKLFAGLLFAVGMYELFGRHARERNER